MELLEYLENKGMKQVICVPPVRQENPNNTTENLKKIFQNFQAGYKGNIKLKLAARYRLDSLFEEKLTHEKLLTISNEKELLVDVGCRIHSRNHATGTNHLLGNRRVRKAQRKRMQADDEFVLFLRI